MRIRLLLAFALLPLLGGCATSAPAPPTTAPTGAPPAATATTHPRLTATAEIAETSAPTSASAAAWREDLHFLVQRTRETHPNFFFHLSAAEFDRAVRVLDEQIPSLSDQQIQVELMRLVALIKDGHTFLSPFQEATGFSIYPLRLYQFSDGLYVVDALAPYREAIGAWVLRIRQVEVDEACTRLAATTRTITT